MSNCRSCRFARGGFDCLVISGIDLTTAVETKLKYNQSRPYRHGGKKA